MRIPDQRSVCCDAPIRLNLLGMSLADLLIPVICCKCGNMVAGAALEDVGPEVRIEMSNVKWRMDKYIMGLHWRFAPWKLPPPNSGSPGSFIKITGV